ncbi:hypothetical protein DYB32_005916 [Aphanomyces invadans]|uniref:Cytochrome c oxidase assembly protein COX15 n=1 Tax=Aphanomyces invadans TaxID=157072 RepID=A0A418AW93_9STRA|nr:hypothetical protein DYB32_005916 [Aphanomyces invadans]
MHLCEKSLQAATKVATLENVAANRPIAWWLMGCAGMVGAMVAVGGATRLTRSGLSMVTWKPHGGLPPITDAEWAEEFELYKKFPEYQQRKSMTVDEFKQIYFWEYSHRMLGRTVGLAFAAPLAYFLIRKRIPKEMYGRLATLFGLGAVQVTFEAVDPSHVISVQGGIGWWMVRSGLEDRDPTDRREIRVSPYRLATHVRLNCMDDVVANLMEHSNNDSWGWRLRPGLQKITQVRKWLHRSATLLAVTIASGAFVAGIDAGMAYNTFPKMGDQWLPDGMFDMEVPRDHGHFFGGGSITGAYALARNPNVWWQIPAQAKTALNLNVAAAAGQVALGITTLLNCVPIPLAIAHQTGALVLMTSTVYTLHTLRFARPLGYKWASTIKQASTHKP